MEIHGRCDPRFRRVREALLDNFGARGELGASVAVYVDGKPVVDLWGGVANHVDGRPWREDTLCLLFSSTKAAAALCAHALVARCRLDLDAPIARYWPEFAAAGKDAISVRMLLNHSAGLAAIDRPLEPDTIFDWATLVDALAAQPPNWRPGTAHGYHAMTFGWLVGELVRRVSGLSIGSFFREAVAGPLGLEFWIGLPPEYHDRVARIRMAPPRREASPLFRAMFNRATLTSRAFMNPRSMLMPGQANSAAILSAEIPAANGMATARSLARMYAALASGGHLDGVELVTREAVESLGQSRAASEGTDLVLLAPTRFTLGFMKSVDNRPDSSFLLGPNASAFGHPGAGGSFGMADPEARIAIGYVMNQMGTGILLNDRGQTLIEATYAAIA